MNDRSGGSLSTDRFWPKAATPVYVSERPFRPTRRPMCRSPTVDIFCRSGRPDMLGRVTGSSALYVTVWYVFRNFFNLAAKVRTQLVQILCDGAVAALVDHPRQGYTIDPRGSRQLGDRHPTPVPELLVR